MNETIRLNSFTAFNLAFPKAWIKIKGRERERERKREIQEGRVKSRLDCIIVYKNVLLRDISHLCTKAFALH